MLERLELEGTVVYRHETDEDRPGGAWADYVYKLYGEHWTYLSGEDELDGPFADLDDALSTSFSLSSVSVSYDSMELTAAGIAAQMPMDFASEGETVLLNGQEWRVVREVLPDPVSRQEVLGVLDAVTARGGSSDVGGPGSPPARNLADGSPARRLMAGSASANVDAVRAEVESGAEIDVVSRLRAYSEGSPEIAGLLDAIRTRGYAIEPPTVPRSVLRLVPAS